MQCIQVRDSPLPVKHNYDDVYHEEGGFKEPDSWNNCTLAEKEASVEQRYYRDDCAVFIRNVYKRYDYGPPILRNFSMNVRKGTIYGLLGSSGCGKTTILSCIVGLQQCDSGDLLVFGREPGTKGSGIPGKRLGYMPQELALYNHLTIREIIQFYGRVYGMESREISKQWDFLNTLLKLPSSSKLVGELSGGQQRRVSLALALIHSPSLLILDEPTVGLDPLLRKDIWDYLYQIVKKLGTTIIITTHYIEEARNSSMIGVMRNGRLLVEDTPSNLLRNYNCDLLEEIVLQLCRKDPNSSHNSPCNELPDNNKFRSSWNGTSGSAMMNNSSEATYFRAIGFDGDLSETFTPTFAVAKSDNNFKTNVAIKIQNHRFFRTFRRIYGFTFVIFMTFIRNPAFLGVTLFMPCIQGTLSLLCLGSKPGGIHLGIVNHELSNWTLECDSAQHLPNSSCDFTALSCKYLNQLQQGDTVVLKSYGNDEEALSQVHLGRISGFLTFPHDYSDSSMDLFAARQFAMNESFDGSRIHAHLDYSQKIRVVLLIKHLLSSYTKYLQELAISCGIGGEEAELPMRFRKPLYSAEDDYTSYIIPGIVIFSLVSIGYALAGILLVSDRKQGTLGRAHVAGLKTGEVITSHLITQGILAVGQLILWNALLYFGFNFVSLGSPWLVIAFCLLSQLCGSTIGIFFAQVFNEEMQILSTGIFLFTFFIYNACPIFPMELIMTEFLRSVSHAVPTTVPTMALRAITIRGVGLDHPVVWSGLLVLIAWIAVLLLVTVAIYKKFNK